VSLAVIINVNVCKEIHLIPDHEGRESIHWGAHNQAIRGSHFLQGMKVPAVTTHKYLSILDKNFGEQPHELPTKGIKWVTVPEAANCQKAYSVQWASKKLPNVLLFCNITGTNEYIT